MAKFSRSNLIESLEKRTLLSTIDVHTDQPLQTIEAMGGNYARAAFGTTVQDSVGTYTLANLNPKYVRVPLLIRDFEPTNDDADPNTFNWAAFKDAGKVHETFLMMQQMQKDGRVISAAVFDAPKWTLTPESVGKTNQQVIATDKYSEVAESIVAFVKYAKDNYGVNISTVSVNEADGGFHVLLTAAENARLIKLTGAKLAQVGLSNVKWLIGDVYQTKNIVKYADAILSDPAVRPYAGPIAFHSWWSETDADSIFTAVADLGKKWNLPIWCNEAGWWARVQVLNKPLLGEWSGAIRLAKVMNKVIRLTGATSISYWQLQNDYPIMAMTSTGPNLFYSYYVVKTLHDNFQPGSQIIKANSDDTAVLPLASRDTARNTFMAQAINTSSSTSKSITFTGLPNQALTLVENRDGQKTATLGTFTPSGGTLTVTAKPNSILTLTGKLGATSTTPTLPAGWTGKDIGAVGLAGKSSATSGVFSVAGAGADIFGTADGFQYAYKSLSGDGQIVARVTGLTNTNVFAKAGLMIRESLAVNATHASFLMTPASGLKVETRKTTGGSTGLASISSATPPAWLKLARAGNTFTYYTSADGTTWSQVASSNFTMGTNVFIGLAVTSHDATKLNTSTFSNVTVGSVVVPPTTTTLSAKDDATVRGGIYSGTNYGSDGQLVVKDASSSDFDRETYLKFDLSTVATINSAKLRLFGRLSDTSNSNVITRVLSTTGTTWSEGTLTWTNKPTTGLTQRGSFTVTDATDRWYEVDLTSFLKAEKAAGRNLVTLVLKSGSITNTATMFNSGEASANQPQLVIT